MTIYDDQNAVIPIQLLKDVIATHVHRNGFHLRILFGKIPRNDDVSTAKV